MTICMFSWHFFFYSLELLTPRGICLMSISLPYWRPHKGWWVSSKKKYIASMYSKAGIDLNKEDNKCSLKNEWACIFNLIKCDFIGQVRCESTKIIVYLFWHRLSSSPSWPWLWCVAKDDLTFSTYVDNEDLTLFLPFCFPNVGVTSVWTTTPSFIWCWDQTQGSYLHATCSAVLLIILRSNR